ncbi:xanthine dehydrogenase family protein molybdopterin-binding subunit [Ramlibacter sp. G-1-2-2]|uniref:Xanthine dehydrogenase family protein molybdopterin-binding subunit n=1 Tax=Ramlibacter agri TaxID=2728837 RepID=A0A848H700_9BURK|nr:molybdopterin cofactor-binding domain-containing protein [Ramlibacter agri]NML45281.1 xanthine dehydrogenase family protein molybdopterin-binding subunit [Ramlibacter agri]
MMAAVTLSRRELLKGSVCIVGFSLLGLPAYGQQQAPRGALPLDQADSFLALRPDGTLVVYSGKVDLGTGHRISMRQMVGEELTLPVNRIELIEGDSALTPNQGPTAGSTGVMRGGVELRRAAATMREALLAQAAQRWGVEASTLKLRDGRVLGADGRSIAWTELPLQKLAVDANAPLKPPAQYEIVGKSLPRPDLPAKVTGQHVWMHDFAVPGMLHARVIRPPAIGAKLLAVDEGSVAQLPDVRVVRVNDFLAVAAPDEWAAIRASRELKTQWSENEPLPSSQKVADWARSGPFVAEETLVDKGDKTRLEALAGDARKLHASYYWPLQSHASMGPSCSVADVRSDGATIWTASQASHRLVVSCAAALGLEQARVRTIYLDGAGCYGMNGHDDASVEAAMLSKALGKPVRVQWSREDELGWDPKGPPQLLEISASLTPEGGIDAWSTEMWLPRATANLAWIPLLSPVAAGLPQPKGQSTGLVSQNGDPPYGAKAMRVHVHWIEGSPLRPSNIRAPGKVGNCFAVESFVDELAARANVDPLQFRLRDLAQPRGREVVERLARLMKWETRAGAAGQGRGRGMAYIHYKHNETFVAMGMDVAVDRKSGEIRVLRVACVHDCGLMINPDAVRAQVEGNILQTLSRTLHEETTFDRSRVTSVDWRGYPLLRFPEVPRLDIELVQRLDQPPLGAGEAAAAPVPAALANAVFDATGRRVRSVPFTRERVQPLLA